VPGPIRLLSHADPPAELLVFDHRRSRGLVAALGPALDAVNRDRGPGAPPVALTVLRWRYDRGRAPVDASLTPVRRVEVPTRFDVWLQDFVEIASLPGPRTLLVDPNRGTGLERFTPRLALRWGAVWVRLPAARPGDASGAGNVEVLPNDLLLLGSTAGDGLADFLLERGYGDRHVRVDTSWLDIGHVDEIVSHVLVDGPCGFALVRAAPAAALALAAADPDPPRWLRRDAERFARHQRVLDARLAGEAAAIRRAVATRTPACAALPVIELPVLFRCEEADGAPTRCRSQRPNAVNMTVLDRHVLVAEPGYAPLRDATGAALEAAGQRVHWLDADAQHERRGGIHCATNVRRTPRAKIVPPSRTGRAATLPR
jgi:hypothetical protein